MTGREKIQGAFSPRGTSEFAAVIPYEDLYIRDNWSSLTALPWWKQFEPSIEAQLEWRSQVHAAMGHDWVCLPLFHDREHRERTRIVRRREEVFAENTETGEHTRLYPPTPSGWGHTGEVESVHPADPPQTPDEIDRMIPPPDPERPQSLVEKGCADLAHAIIQDFGRDLYPIAHVNTPLWCCYGLWGFAGLMERIVEQPDLVRHACRRFLECAISGVEVAAALGAQGIWMEECLTDQISPEAFAELHLPFLVPLVESIRSSGMHSIYYFCGDPSGKWELILSAGADALALEESKKKFDIQIEDVVARVNGRCAVLGNLDSIGVLQNGTEEELRSEIARQTAAGRLNRGRFVMSLGSPPPPGTPPERLRLYCELTRELGSN